MFARTWSVSAKEIDLGNPEEVAAYIVVSLQKEFVGKRPFKFTFFVDADPAIQKLVFYDMSIIEQVIEFSAFFGRLPQYSVVSDAKTVRVCHYHPDQAFSKVMTIATAPEGNGATVTAVALSPTETESETKSLRAVASTTEGFLDVAGSIGGNVTCQIMEHEETHEKRAVFTVKIDGRSEKNRAIIRSCEKMHFAWSDQASYMVLLCRFKMLPPFALTFPVLGQKLVDAMHTYMKTDSAVGMVMYTDDVTDTFNVEKGRPTFETPEEGK